MKICKEYKPCVTEFSEEHSCSCWLYCMDQAEELVKAQDKERQKAVWRTVGNPGAVLRGGKVIGQWNVRTQKDRLHIQIKLWEHISAAEYNKAEQLADEYAAFRQAKLVDLRID